MLTEEQQKKFTSIVKLEEELNKEEISSEILNAKSSDDINMEKVFTEDISFYERVTNLLYMIDNSLIGDKTRDFIVENLQEEISVINETQKEVKV